MPQLSNNMQVSPELNILLKVIFVPAKYIGPYSWDLLKDPWLVATATEASEHVVY